MVKNEGDPLREVVLCPPGREYVGAAMGDLHSIRQPRDLEQVGIQYRSLKETITSTGARVHEIPELEGHPNSVFTRDSALVVSSGFVRLRMGLPSRMGEESWMATHLRELGLEEFGQIGVNGSADGAGTLEGGDVILAGDVAFLGRSDRSNAEGLRQLWGILGRLGFEVRVAEIGPEFMHLGGAMSLVGPETLVACTDIFPEGYFRGFEVVGVPCHRGGASGANVICLSDREVIANSKDGEESLEAMDRAGIRVHALDLSEYRKGDGGPTCMILPVERA